MCKSEQISHPGVFRRLTLFSTTLGTLALGLLCSMLTSSVSAQTCLTCPANAQASAIGASFSIFAIQGNETNNVSGGTVGACNTLILVENVSYNPNGQNAQGQIVTGAGFTGGTGHVILPNGTAVNVTPSDMSTTLVGPAPCGTTTVKGMTTITYNLTAADILAGSAVFTFQYTNGLSLLTNQNGQCILHVQASPQQSVTIAPAPTCSIAPASQTICQGASATFTFTGSLATGGPLPITYCWQKGCPGAGSCLSTSNSITFNNAQPSDSGCYTVTATDSYGCSTNCTATLTVNPNPTCQITGLTPVPCLSTNTYTVSVTPSNNTVTYSWAINGNGTIVGSTTGSSVTVVAGASGSFTLTNHITVNGCPGGCSTSVNITPCVPCIKVTKEVACFLGPNAQGADTCGPFSKFASGVQANNGGVTEEPAFCFRIGVSNCSDKVTLTNVTVIDDKYGDLTSHFSCISPTFAPGASCTFEFKVQIGTTGNTVTVVTNTVIAVGQSASTGQSVSDTNTAAAQVVPASVACNKFYTIDGGPATNNVTLQDQSPHTVVFYATITNTGVANLLDLAISDAGNIGSCPSTFALRELAEGASITFAVCTNASLACSNSAGFSDTISVVVNTFTYTTNEIPLCSHMLNGSNITAVTECTASIFCVTPAACRVTGGGRQDLSEEGSPICPPDVRYVTHGGQVGAPVGNKVCSIDTNLPSFWLGNPCIHGRWTHVRHVQGGLEGNFHARFFDTLDCACLDTNFLSPNTCQYGQGTVVNGVCGNRNIGPEPRKAPANKIAFTGVGDWACPNGERRPRACLFRVDIEDRGEPGNDHVLDLGHKSGRVPDRYRIRIWVLSDAELAQLNSATPVTGVNDPYLLNFRNCISACNGIDFQDGTCQPRACVSTSSCTTGGAACTSASTCIRFGNASCGVRLPNIDDGGELLHGNHQIHPSIMACDPFNPVGPGLAKP